MKVIIKQYKFFLILLLLIMVSGCGPWNNFTTYFNRYYNTQKLFNEAEESIIVQKKSLFDTENLLLPRVAKQKLDKVIKSASKILQFNSDSKYLDDAILMLGKAFYYKKNYQKGLRKFEELIATQPNSDLIDETELWLAKSQLKLENFASGLKTLESVKDNAKNNENTELLQQAYIVEISYKINSKDILGAIKIGRDFIEILDDDNVKAFVWYELADLYTQNKDYKNAENAYQQSASFASEYAVVYNSNIELAKTLRAEDKNTEALELLNNMKDEDKNLDKIQDIELEIALTLYNMNKIDDAKEILTEIDTTSSSNISTAIARYSLAQIYEYDEHKLDSANIYYAKAKSSALPKEYIDENNKKVILFRKYSNFKKSIVLWNKQIEYKLNPSLYVKDSTEYYDAVNAIRLKNDALRNKLLKKTNSTFTNPNTNKNKTVLVDEEINPNTPNQTINTNKSLTTSKPVKLKAPPIKSKWSVDSLKNAILSSQFELANLYFTDFNLPDTAYKYYNDILTNHPNSIYESKSLYSVGNYYLEKEDTAQAKKIFNDLYNRFNNNVIVNSVAKIIGKPVIDFNYDPAKELYNDAQSNLKKENAENSLNKFYSIYNKYPKSKFAAKSLYAAGWVLENNFSLYDSAATVYNILRKKYPKSTYSLKISNKILVYNNEIRRKKALKVIQEKLKREKAKSKLKKPQITNKVKFTKAQIDSIRNYRKAVMDSLRRAKFKKKTGKELLEK